MRPTPISNYKYKCNTDNKNNYWIIITITGLVNA